MGVTAKEIPMNFYKMLTYITQCFPEAKGYQEEVKPELPGDDRSEEVTRKVRHTQAKPVQFFFG